jgi:hypothetical protein
MPAVFKKENKGATRTGKALSPLKGQSIAGSSSKSTHGTKFRSISRFPKCPLKLAERISQQPMMNHFIGLESHITKYLLLGVVATTQIVSLR